jgi:hypothetical protein
LPKCWSRAAGCGDRCGASCEPALGPGRGQATIPMTPAAEPPTSGPRPPRDGGAGLGFLPLVLLAACCSVHLLLAAGALAAVGAWVGQPAVAAAGIALAAATLTLHRRNRRRRLIAGGHSVRCDHSGPRTVPAQPGEATAGGTGVPSDERGTTPSGPV